MAFSLTSGFCVSGIDEAAISSRKRGVPGLDRSVSSSRIDGQNKKVPPFLTAVLFMGKQVLVSDGKDVGDRSIRCTASFSVHATGCVSGAERWWNKGLKPNMVEINSAQELVNSLLHAGDRLVVVDFYSPSCGGCRALRPKVSQLAELYPNAIFLKVNYEELGKMCDCLNIRVLPFFQFYRGAKGRVCSFSCTSATIKKFKDALVKHGGERCGTGPAKGLDDSELLRLASCREISMDFPLPGKETILPNLMVSNTGNSIREESHSLRNV